MNLSIKNLNLNYAYKSVLKNLSVDFSEGKIHAVLGENGAGKSTLAKIICGELLPDSGFIHCIDNSNDYCLFPSKAFSVKTAIEKGICYVHQRPLLAENATIYENVILGLKTIDKKRIEELIKIWMPHYSAGTFVKNIGGDCNFFTALICALLKNPKILILDEPGALLNDEQIVFLYENLKELKKSGTNIIVITHSKTEAQNFCDTTTVLDEGKILYNNENTSLENIKLDFLNENHEATEKIRNEEFLNNTNEKNLILNFSELNCHPVNRAGIKNVSFSAIGGEITLISGLAENGLETLENVITGMETAKFSGYIKISGPDFKNSSDSGTSYRFRKFSMLLKKSTYNTNILRNKSGFSTAIIPSNKNFRASNPNLTIKQMLSFSPLTAEQLIQKAEINISENEKASCLSGGMLQRLILQRELSLEPEIMIFCEPLQGLDFASSEKICSQMVKLAASGKIILVLSSADFPDEICKNKYELLAGRLCMVEK